MRPTNGVCIRRGVKNVIVLVLAIHFAACSDFCETPEVPADMTLSRKGKVQSGDSIFASCTEDKDVVIGPRQITCTLGNWIPGHFGCCRNINQLGTVVYNNAKGKVVVKYHTGTFVVDLGKKELFIEFLIGGYGIAFVNNYFGKEEPGGHTWKIKLDKIFRDDVEVPQATYGTIRMKGWKKVPKDSSLPTLLDKKGVVIKDGILYVDGKPTAQRNGDSHSSIDIYNVKVVDETKSTKKPIVTTAAPSTSGHPYAASTSIVCFVMYWFWALYANQ